MRWTRAKGSSDNTQRQPAPVPTVAPVTQAVDVRRLQPKLSARLQEPIAGLQRGYRVVHMLNDVAHGDDIEDIRLAIEMPNAPLVNLKPLASGIHTGLRVWIHTNRRPSAGSRYAQKRTTAATHVKERAPDGR